MESGSEGLRRALLIAGPTASGKSAAALALAKAFGATIVNANSMQVYADLRVLTARPTPEEEASAPHRLFGEIDGAINYSVGSWSRRAQEILAGIGTEPVIFVGGTGLYFRALTEGLSDMPAVPEAVRAAIRAKAEGRATADLHAELAALDPATAARLRPSDRQRILRALEVFAATGRPLASFQGARAAPALNPGEWAGLFLAPGPGGALPAHRRPLRRDAERGRARRGRRADEAPSRSGAAGHAGARGPASDRPFRRKAVARRGRASGRSSTPATTPSASSPGRGISSRASTGSRRRRRSRRECARSGRLGPDRVSLPQPRGRCRSSEGRRLAAQGARDAHPPKKCERSVNLVKLLRKDGRCIPPRPSPHLT